MQRRALRLPPPPGEPSGRFGGGGPELRVLVVGDSIAAGIGADRWPDSLAARFAEALAAETRRPVAWRADGRSGDRIDDLLRRLAPEPDLAAPADVVLVSIGVNDVTGLTRLRVWRARVATLIGRLRSVWPGARLVFVGLPPMARFPLPPQPLRACLGLRAQRLDRILAAQIRGCSAAMHVPTRIDPTEHGFCPDGFHPSPEAYVRWGRELAARLLAQWTASEHP